MKSNERHIIEAVRELHAISSAGLLYTKDAFDKERYGRIQEIAAELLSVVSKESYEENIKIFEDNAGY